MYTALVLTDEARATLEKKFPPKYDKFIGHHVTVEFGVPEGTKPPSHATVKAVGRKDSGDGLEVIVVSVNDGVIRKDDGIYHITWSLDPEKYAPKDSNALLKDNSTRYIMCLPLNIDTNPELLA